MKLTVLLIKVIFSPGLSDIHERFVDANLKSRRVGLPSKKSPMESMMLSLSNTETLSTVKPVNCEPSAGVCIAIDGATLSTVNEITVVFELPAVSVTVIFSVLLAEVVGQSDSLNGNTVVEFGNTTVLLVLQLET